MSNKTSFTGVTLLVDTGDQPVSGQLLDLIEDPLIRRVFEVWLTSRDGQLVPRKDHIDPLSFTAALPYFWIYDYLADIPNFRCRLAGEEVQAAWGTRTTGHFVTDYVAKEHAADVVMRWTDLLETPKIQLGRTAKLGQDIVERICLPVADSNGHINLLYGATSYRDGAAVERTVSTSGYPSDMIIQDQIHQALCADL